MINTRDLTAEAEFDLAVGQSEPLTDTYERPLKDFGRLG